MTGLNQDASGRPLAALGTGRGAHWTLAVILAFLHLALAALVLSAPNVGGAIDSAQVAPYSGFGYSVELVAGRSRIWKVESDRVGAPYVSTVRVFEDGRALGPAHSVHVELRDRGAGRYSYWDDVLLFSASDNTDPRTNGRRYSFSASSSLLPAIKWPWLAFLLAADLGLAWVYRDAVAGFLRRRLTLLVSCAAAIAVTITAAAAAGLFGTVRLTHLAQTKDAALAWSVLVHALLGCAVTFIPWLATTGALQFAPVCRRRPLLESVIAAYPASMALSAALAATVLLVPGGRFVAGTLLLIGLALLALRRDAAEWRELATVAVLIVPFALLFGAWQGLLWHGPTETLNGAPSGDLAFYGGLTSLLAQSPYPLPTVGVEAAPDRGYFNLLFPALGAALADVSGFDPFVYIPAGGSAAYVLLQGVMLYAVTRARPDDRPKRLPLAAALFAVVCLLAAIRYPYWVVESIPMVHVPALTMAVWWMGERARTSPALTVAALPAALFGSALSKVVTAPPLILLACAPLAGTLRRLPPVMMALLAGSAALALIYAGAMTLHFLPPLLQSHHLGPQSFISSGSGRIAWWYAARDAGVVLLAIATLRIAGWSAALPVAVGYAAFLAYADLFNAAFVCATIIVGLSALRHPAAFARNWALALAGVLMVLPVGLKTEPSDAVTKWFWLVCIGGSALVALTRGVDLTAVATRQAAKAGRTLATAIAAVTGLGLIGAAHGTLTMWTGWAAAAGHLTPQAREAWRAVRDLVPADALVFTDQTGETPTIAEGWNPLPAIGGRRTFLSDYYSSFTLRNDPARRRDAFRQNRDVLDGGRPANAFPLSRAYSGYFALTARSAPVPAGTVPLFSSSEFVLYRLPQ